MIFKIQELETHDTSNGAIYLDYEVIYNKFLGKIPPSVQLNLTIQTEPCSFTIETDQVKTDQDILHSFTIKTFNPNKAPIKGEKYNESTQVRTIEEVRSKLDSLSKAASIKSITPSSKMELESAEQVTIQAIRAITG